MGIIPRESLHSRIIEYLYWASNHEDNRRFWDDYAISIKTVREAFYGNPQPDMWASYQHLGLHPRKVWPAIVAREKRMLGEKEYAHLYDENGNKRPGVWGIESFLLPPKKPAHSEKFAAVALRKIAGAEEVPRNQKRRELVDSRRLENVEGPKRMASTASRYPNSGQSASANIAASLCLSCRFPVSVDRRLCSDCLKRGHSAACPSPQNDCTCGFSEFFWLDVEAGSGVECRGLPNQERGNAASTRLLATSRLIPADRRHSTPPPEDEP